MQYGRKRYNRSQRWRMKYARRRRINFKRFIPFLFFLILGIVSLSLLIDYAMDSAERNRENTQLSQEYSETFLQETPEPSDVPDPEVTVAVPDEQIEIPSKFHALSGQVPQKARNLHQQNNDLVGWLYIPGIVSLPVVYRDNEYYLTHAFNGKRDSGGTLFLDENHPLTEEAQHLVIHGHNMHDSSMFGILRSYEKQDIMKSHAFARFSTMYAPEDYVIFAVMRVKPNINSTRYFNYIGRPAFANADAFNDFVSEVKRRSMYDIPVDVQPTDALLTLATCIEEDRLAVFFRRVRDNETMEALQAQIDMAIKQ